MVQLTHFKQPFSEILTFDMKKGRRVDVEFGGDWKNEAFVKAVTTLVTGADHTKLRESIEVVDKDGLRLYYLEKL